MVSSSVKKAKGRTRSRAYKIDSKIKINSNVHNGTFAFGEIFKGFENLEALTRVFGSKKLDQVLLQVKIEVFPRDGFMGVSDEDGHIFASQQYLNRGEKWSVYLDIIHELVHVRQFHEGKNLFDPQFAYVDRPTEVEAYKVAVEEARRIGLSEEEIFSYLEVPWISREELERLAQSCGVAAQNINKAA